MEFYRAEFMNQQQENEYNNVKDIIKNGGVIDLTRIEKEYFYNLKIQSAIVKRYIEENKYKQAIKICKKNEFYDVIQSQLVTIYINERRYDEAIKICQKFPENNLIQNRYKELRNYQTTYNDDVLQERINIFVNQDDEYYKKDGDTKILSLEEGISNPILDEIRAKLSNGTIGVKDIELLKKLESDIDVDIYKFIMIAICHKLGLVKTALQILKTIDKKYNHYKSTLYSMLADKKSKIYNLGFYDEIINWHSTAETVAAKELVKIKKV